jgi:hypothetical protein
MESIVYLTTIIAIMVFFAFMAPVPIGPTLLIRSAVPIYVGPTFTCPILAPIALLVIVPIMIIMVLLIVIAMMLSIITITVPVISILQRSGSYNWH